MKTNSLIISEEAIVSVLREYSAEIQHNECEYMVSIFMKRRLEKDHQRPYCIAFEARNDVKDKRKYFNGTAKEFKDILKKSINEDTPIDFGLVEGTVYDHSDNAFAFQVKRFIAYDKQNINQQLLDYLMEILTKYKPGDVSLIVVPTINSNEIVPLEINYIISNLVVPVDSFKAIFLLIPDQESVTPLLKRIWVRK